MDVTKRDPKLRLTGLHHAAKHGRVSTMTILIEHGADVNARSYDGTTPLGSAVGAGKLPAVKLLLRHGVDIELKGFYDRSPFHLAVSKHFVPAAKLLQGHGADINSTNRLLWTPLQSALDNDDLAAARWLLELGADTEVPDEAGHTPIVRWCDRQKLEKVRLLLEFGARFDVLIHKGFREEAPLVNWAALTAQNDLLRMLLDQGASPNNLDSHGETPLGAACHQSNCVGIRMLLAEGADPSIPDRFGQLPGSKLKPQRWAKLVAEAHDLTLSAPRPITWAGWVSACSEGRDTRIRSAIAAGMDVTKRDPKLRLTGLHHATKHGRVSTMTILIEHGADVNARSKRLKGEARLGKVPEAAVTTIPQDGTTPLGAAARAGKLPAVKRLLRHGADIELKGFLSMSPFHEAVSSASRAVAKYLLTRGADINSTDRLQCTPLQSALENDDLKTARWLVEQGADMESRDSLPVWAFDIESIGKRLQGRVDVVNRSAC
ncbi:hypothetical protein FNF27_00386 [Cafeteria roenbergensis]|uniref:Uncharacterized protein n=1 Tax=Cafeteria roenbergensis TaxID=33653 RepID=A0A5A8ENA9_CAFRO|nr:hypothetical protein FNF27_00386 [Cafeteria roenbergensis]